MDPFLCALFPFLYPECGNVKRVLNQHKSTRLAHQMAFAKTYFVREDGLF